MSSQKEPADGFDFLVPTPNAIATQVQTGKANAEVSEKVVSVEMGDVSGLFGRDSRRVHVTGEEFRDFWSSKLAPMVRTMADQGDQGSGGIRGFEVDQVTIHVGVGAEGLFFVGRASAEASIEVVLRRTHSAGSHEPLDSDP